MNLARAVRLRDLRRKATFTDDLHDAIADIPPGWWYSLGYCSVSCDASIGPDVAYCDKDTLKRFDSGFHADIPQPSTLAEALRNCIEQAETAAIAQTFWCREGTGVTARAFAIRHFGLLTAATGVALASAIYLCGGFHAVGMVIACMVAISVGDAWDEEGRNR